MKTEVGQALSDVLLENTPMDEIVEEYGMETAQEVGELMSMAHNAIVDPETGWEEAKRLYEHFRQTMAYNDSLKEENSFSTWLRRNYTLMPR